MCQYMFNFILLKASIFISKWGLKVIKKDFFIMSNNQLFKNIILVRPYFRHPDLMRSGCLYLVRPDLVRQY